MVAALVASLVLHVAAFIGFVAIEKWSANHKPPLDVTPIIIVGEFKPTAKAAPKDLPVDPNANLPDVVEAQTPPPSAPEPETPAAPPEPTTPEVAPALDDAVPIAPKAPDKPPVVEKKEDKPPQPTPPVVKPPKDEEKEKKEREKKEKERKEREKKEKARKEQEAIDKKMKELARKVEAAENADDAADEKMWDLTKASGGGDGESSAESGQAGKNSLHPEVNRYYNLVTRIIRDNWVPPVETLSTVVEATFFIRIEPDGTVSESRLVASSRNKGYDESVERAINTSKGSFPPPPPIFEGRAVTITYVFNSQQLQGLR